MIPHLSERGLILAPQGRDAEVAASMLAEAKVRSVICSSLAELLERTQGGGGLCPGDGGSVAQRRICIRLRTGSRTNPNGLIFRSCC